MANSTNNYGAIDPMSNDVARRIWDDPKMSEEDKTKRIIWEVFGGNVAEAAAHWLEITGSEFSEEAKRKHNSETIAIANSQSQMQADYDAIQQKHSSFLSKLDDGHLFKNEAEFKSDFSSFGAWLDDTIPVLSKENAPDENYIDAFNKAMRGSKAFQSSGKKTEDAEQAVRDEGKDPEHDLRPKVVCFHEHANIIHQLGLTKDPTKCTTLEEIQEIENVLGVKFSELNGLPLSEIKERFVVIKEISKVVKNPEEYQKLMEKLDPRLDAFRDKSYKDLSKEERLELASTVRDMSYEKQVRLLRIDMKEKGYSNEQIEERIAQIAENRGLIEDKNLSAKWQEAIALEAAGNIDASLRKRIETDISSKGSIQSFTFKKIVMNLPEEDFNKMVKDNNLDNNQPKEILAEQLRQIYRSNPNLQSDVTNKVQQSLAESDKKNELATETQQKPSFLSNFSNLWNNATQSPAQEAATVAVVAAASPVAGATMKIGGLISDVMEKPEVKAAMENVKKACSCEDEKPKIEQTPRHEPLAQMKSGDDPSITSSKPPTDQSIAQNQPAASSVRGT